MNGARSTFMRKGYWLTGLAAIVLLAASSGTALAQSVGFSRTSITVEEGASSEMDTGAPQIVDINIGGLVIAEGATTNTGGLGVLTLAHDSEDTAVNDATARVWLVLEGSTALAEASHTDSNDNDDMDGLVALGPTTELNYDKNGIIKLAIIDPGDENWKNDTFNMALRTDALNVTPSPGSAMVTVTDTDVAPVVKFTPALIKLNERSSTTTTVTVVEGAKDKGIPEDIISITSALRLRVSNPSMVFTGGTADEATACNAVAPATTGPAVAITGANVSALGTMGDNDGTFEITGSNVGGADIQSPGVRLTIEACDETMDFRDALITLTPVASSLMGGPGGPGDIGAGAGLSIAIESDEAVPVVTFSAPGLIVDEGGDTSVYIVTTTMQGDEVGEVDLSVSGDALITLSQSGTALTANADDTYTASFGMDANTRLTVTADNDESLHDDQQKTATLTIVDANGAEIGDEDSVTVTVNGVGVEPDPEPDPEPATPTVSFTTTSLDLDEGGNGTVSFDVVDEDDVGVEAVMVSVSDGAAIALHQDDSALVAGADGNYAVDPSKELMVSADADEALMDAEFKQATLAIEDGGDAYAVGDNGSVAVTVSGDSAIPPPVPPVPTVSFANDSISVDEGESESLFLIANVVEDAEVGSAALTVTGDALISLSQDGSDLAANADGTYSVDFGGSENASLTVTADEDADLYAGDPDKTATVTITGGEDAEPADSNTTLTVTVSGVGEREDPPAPATPTVSFAAPAVSIDEGDHGVVSIDVVDADEVGVETVMVSVSGSAAIALYQGGSALEAGADGNYAVSPSADVTVSSEPDEDLMDGEQTQATLTLVDADAYDVSGNESVAVTVVGSSDVPGPLPTVSFLDPSLTLREGEASTVRLQRMGDFRGEPGTVMVSIAGDAVLSLSQDGNALADDGAGNYTVSLGSGGLTDLTVTSEPDPDLEDGAVKSATLTLADGYGAVAGDSAMLAVEVIGSSAVPEPEPVPALPLIAQWLLGLGLMGGGARKLYRRRQG